MNTTKLIRHMARVLATRSGCEESDLVQEGEIALLQAGASFQEGRGAALWTYARKFVLGAMVRYLAREWREPARPQEESPIIDGAPAGWAGFIPVPLVSHDPSPEDVAARDEDLSILSQVIDVLTDAEREILWKCFGEDKSLRDVSRELDQRSHVGVQRIFHGALEKLRERMEARA